MANTLNVTVKETNGNYEGTVSISGLRNTKLVRKDGSTLFPTTSALKTTARGLATRLGLTVEYTAKAAKKSIKNKTTKPCCSSTGTCCSQPTSTTTN